MALAGISTLGVKLGYAVETTKGQKPAAFTLLERINSIGEISLTPEKIDASALEDMATRYVAGRSDTSGNFDVTINFTSETEAAWTSVISAYNALTNGKRMWFEVYIPTMSDGCFVVAQPPQKLPLSSIAQNGLLTVTISLALEEYVGWDTAVEPTAAQ